MGFGLEILSRFGGARMSKEVLATTELEKLLDLYEEAARTHGRATEAGDSPSANSAAGTVSAVYMELRRRGIEAQRKMLVLLENSDSAVRLWAASHALEFAPDEGEPILLYLADARNSPSDSAQR